MIFFHCSVKQKVPSILRIGIEPSCSLGARQECWFVTGKRLPWAILHIANRHQVGIGDVRVFIVDVPRRRMTKRGSGVFTSMVNVAVNPSSFILTGDQVKEE